MAGMGAGFAAVGALFYLAKDPVQVSPRVILLASVHISLASDF